MKRTSKGVTILATLGLFSALLAVNAPMASGVAATVKVQVGAPLFVEPQANHAPADGDRFYAPALTVHKGDTVTFDFQGFHTATLLPANTDADAWVETNAIGLGKPYSFVVPDPDEGATAVKINSAAIFPSQLDCGAPTDPCPYDGSGVVNSGIFDAGDLQAQSFAYSTRIDANPGAQFTYLCLIHLKMRQTISVVADTETTTTQAEIDTYRDLKVKTDARVAGQTHASLLEGNPSKAGVVDAYAGYDGSHFSLLAFYPRKIELTKGQTVRWHFDALVFEDHTVTFPSKKALKIANNSFLAVCDPDGDTGTLPDEPADNAAATLDDVCPGGVTQIEFSLDPKFGPPAGDGVASSVKEFESSGIRGSNLGIADPFEVKFTKRTEKKKPYTYICLIHPFMQGKVIVR
jgi:plastocyanin